MDSVQTFSDSHGPVRYASIDDDDDHENSTSGDVRLAVDYTCFANAVNSYEIFSNIIK